MVHDVYVLNFRDVHASTAKDAAQGDDHMPGFNGSCGSFGQKWRIQQIVLIGHQRDLVVCPPEYALEMQGGVEAAKTSPEDEKSSP
jgi:hypothetical protein